LKINKKKRKEKAKQKKGKYILLAASSVPTFLGGREHFMYA
jgi:hypothetical protein